MQAASNGTNNNSSSSGFTFPSPQPHAQPISPAPGPAPAQAADNNNLARTGASSSGPGKFRYPSGPGVAGMSPGGASTHSNTTSNSAMSSREGTPGPGLAPNPAPAHRPALWDSADTGGGGGPAPNVDISHVTVKEEFLPGSSAAQQLMRPYADTAAIDDYSRRPSVNLSYPAPVSSHLTDYGSVLSSGGGYGGYHAMPQQVALPPRPSFHHPGMRPSPHPGSGLHPAGRPLTAAGDSGSSSHSNVKIGRRPAHLPKVLKFSDTTLPHGWVRKLKQRKHGKQAGRWDVYIYSPCGVKFASRKKLRHFFEKNNLQYDPEDFDFTPYGRHIEQGGGGHGRHHSSGEAGAGAGAHRSPSSVSSAGSYATPPGLHQDYKSDFLGGSSHGPPTAHRPHSYHPAHHQAAVPGHSPLFPADYNPMMESPPNANALEVPQHQILNLSQPQVLPGQRPAPAPPAPAPAAPGSNFPPDIATILNEGSPGADSAAPGPAPPPAGAQFRPPAPAHHPSLHREFPHRPGHPPDTGDTEEAAGDKKEESQADMQAMFDNIEQYLATSAFTLRI